MILNMYFFPISCCCVSCRVLKTSDGKTVSLASFEGKPLVLFFYPKAATPGCTKEVSPQPPAVAKPA
jgi:peroxiredoxin